MGPAEQCPLNLTLLEDMESLLAEKVNVAGKIVSISEPETSDGTKLLNVKIRDQNADNSLRTGRTFVFW